VNVATIEAKPNSISAETFSSPTRTPASHWYVAQTCAQHERRVSDQLGQRSIENCLPLYERVSQWKDRRVRLQVPLFAGYVFVRFALGDRLRVLELPGVVRLVGFGRQPAALRDEEIESIRNSLNLQLRAEPHPFLSIGERVRINRGPLEGVEGILVRKRSSIRLVLSVELIQRSIALEINAADVTAIPCVTEGKGARAPHRLPALGTI
jgi:transcription antitermination factor NusG